MNRADRPGRGVGQWLALALGVPLILAVVGIGLAVAADATVTARRQLLVDHIAPAQVAAIDLDNALINEETGVRGFIITREQAFLAPYRDGMAAEARDYSELLSLLRGSAARYAREAETVRSRAQSWEQTFVAHVLGGTPPSTALNSEGKSLFDRIRTSLATLESALSHRRTQARAELYSAASRLKISLELAGALIVVGLLGAGILMRRIFTTPLARLGEEARRVAGGDFETPLATISGAREIVEVRGEVDTMRELIVRDLAAVKEARSHLQQRALELTRSNDDLEQFAYVASHDLQEPLRKVTSFCRLLQQRYQGQLDDRADQYLHFAVDGASRMQILINDLLAFSRVGRTGHPHELLDMAELVDETRASLSQAITDAGATVTMSELPTVRGDRALLVSVFRNLIANGLKFRSSDAPVIRIEAHRGEHEWEISCADNGIGVEPEFAERIFVIFQRLHSRDSYPGTGIGLAMCRRIIEYHGGRIWLDTSYDGGACVRFTVPVVEGSPL